MTSDDSFKDSDFEAEQFDIVIREHVNEDCILPCFMELFSSSEEEEEDTESIHRGKSANKQRDFGGSYAKIVRNYFSGRDSVYNEKDFERKFRMPRSLFNRIRGDLLGHDPFLQKCDVTGKLGINPLVKLVGCLRYIAYGDAYDREDENLGIAESTLRDYVKDFTKLILRLYAPEYLNRFPTAEERQNISSVMARKGFPGCLGFRHIDPSSCKSFMLMFQP